MKYNFILQFFILLNVVYFPIFAQNSVQETAEVFFPEKVVMALNHPYYNYSINDAYLKGMKYDATFGDPNSKEYYRTTVPLVSIMTNPMENSDAFEFEMKSAKLMGIDGFQFELRPSAGDYYLNRFKKIFTDYVKVAEDNNIDFKFSIVVDMKRSKKMPVSLLLMKVGNTLNELFKATNYSKKWLRTGNNKVVVFLKYPQKVMDEGFGKKYVEPFIANPNLIKNVAEVYESLRKGLVDDVAFVYQADHVADPQLVNQILDYFPAIYTSSSTQNYALGIERLAEVCKERNRPFIQCVFSELKGTKRYDVHTDKKLSTMKGKTSKMADKETYVRAHNYKMTSMLRDLLEKGIERDADMLTVYSWNFFNRGTHFAPELHHGYGLGIILNYYKNRWLNSDKELENEVVLISFKNFLPGELNQTKGVKVKFREKEQLYLNDLDSVEVVTQLKEGGEVYFNNQYMGFAPKGIHAFYALKEKGKMEVKVKREKLTVLEYTTPKEVIGKQSYTDFLTYSFSNLDDFYATANQNIILENEMNSMRNRFLISKVDEVKWRNAATKRFSDNLTAMYQYGLSSNKYLEIQEKNYKKYKQQIKEILTEFNYSIWLELEESAKKQEGIPMFEDNQNEALKGYNILPEYTKQK
ncbi:hypothetical protein [Flammeovirga sp. EKP202]|uniref:hypothetical protein n=1 Tax=Flammeovirga sp. EKP202 TaxID=2770592 RepID=UPI00165EC68C|nr:hypothetical protein [Flammeovirga sp. EKP202]MBD0401972.1 hypothetical protein [Flammeovirga sp. EKP202]